MNWLAYRARGRWQAAVLQQFNQDIAATIDSISLFVGWHYASGSAFDSPFWQLARQNFAEQWTKVQNRPVGQRFEQMRQAGAAFSAEQLPLIPDPQSFASQIAPHRQLNQDFAGFDEFSFAQVGNGMGCFSA